jgi:tetratricopeptide (TPR) repeat protein
MAVVPSVLAQAMDAHRRGATDTARHLYESVLKTTPDQPLALHLLGKIHLDQKNPMVALSLFEKARALSTSSLELEYDMGRALHQVGRIDDALRHFEGLAATHPAERAVHAQLGSLLAARGAVAEAVACYTRALALDPDNAELLKQRGRLLLQCDASDAAIADLVAAARVRADDPECHFLLGAAYSDTKQYQQALAHLDETVRLRPGYIAAQLGRAPLLFALGRLMEGWEAYRYRHLSLGPEGRPFPSPKWRGEPLQGKRLLLTFEQGLGEQIMFASMLPDLIETGVTIRVEVHPRLMSLFERSFPGIEFVPWQKPVHPATLDPALHFHIPFGDIGVALRKDFSAFRGAVPYLRPDPDKVIALRKELRERSATGYLVGVVWASHAQHSGAAKSIPLQQLSPLLNDNRLTIVSLQHGSAPDLDTISGPQRPLLLEQGATEDLETLAAAVAAMDAVVTISTAAAHLAGALAKPTFVLVPHKPKWQYWYWFAGRRPNPWYPTATIVSQPERGQWGPAVTEVAQAVGQLVKNRPGERPASP